MLEWKAEYAEPNAVALVGTDTRNRIRHDFYNSDHTLGTRSRSPWYRCLDQHLSFAVALHLSPSTDLLCAKCLRDPGKRRCTEPHHNQRHYYYENVEAFEDPRPPLWSTRCRVQLDFLPPEPIPP